MKFAHLHQHTQYSLLDGAARLGDLLSWVKEVSPDEPALAVTDHGNLFGAIDFYQKASAAGIKPVIGYEAYVAADSRFDRSMRRGLDGGYFHLTLLAKNNTGYQNLVKLASRAYLEGFYFKPRVDREILREHSEGIIALSGCLGAEIPQFIMQDRIDLAEARLQEYLDIFKTNYYIEVQDHGLAEESKINPVLREFAKKYGLGMVATNDGHYVKKDDAEAHAVLLAIQSKSTWDDPRRWQFPCDEFYVKSPEEMRAAFGSDWPDEIFDQSAAIAQMCQVDFPIGDQKVYRIPRFPLAEGESEAEHLRGLAYAGLNSRYPELDFQNPDPQAQEILDRLTHELAVIERMGFPGYFLIVADYINWSKDHGIAVGPGRGSAAGSLVAYLTGITELDPLRFGLLFERFLNPERVSMPDIDVDFSDRARDQVIEYVRERYGADRVAQIGTFGTLASKAAIKDAARVFRLPVKRAEELAKLIPVNFGKPMHLEEALEAVPELKAACQDPLVEQVITVATRLEGLSRHASVHAAGVVIGDVPLMEVVPLMRDQSGTGIVTQFDMNSVEALGLLKMDFLGLRTLTFLEECTRIVAETGDRLEIAKIPLDDQDTFDFLAKGETEGVFQLESPGMSQTVRALRPTRLEDLIALVSLYRPGPMEQIPTYIRRAHGEEPVRYDEFPAAAELLEPILGETYGIPVYQEQIMQIASAVAGYSLGEADLLRRAMGKKKLSEMVAQREKFLAGAQKQGVPGGEASALFDLLEKFANYGFNKSHAAAYALISYQTAYVKAHFPVAFQAALLSVEQKDTDKLAEYIRAARVAGVAVRPPDINLSGFDFLVAGEAVVFGLSAVRNVGEGAARAILEERQKGGPYTSLADFLLRLNQNKVPRRAVEFLIKAGAFDSTGAQRSELLAALEGIFKWAAEEQTRAQVGMVGLFAQEERSFPLPEVAPLAELERLAFEKEALAIYLSGHPLDQYPDLAQAASFSMASFKEQIMAGQKVRGFLAGMVETVARKPTKNGGMLARFVLSDPSGALEFIVFGSSYDRVSPLLNENQPVLILAEGELEGEGLRSVAQELFTEEALASLPGVLRVELELDLFSYDQLLDLRDLLDEHAGKLSLELWIKSGHEQTILRAPGIRCSGEVIAELERFPGTKAFMVPDPEGLARPRRSEKADYSIPF